MRSYSALQSVTTMPPKPPFAVKNLGEQPAVVAGVDTVDFVAKAHYRVRIALLYSGLERDKVDLPQGPLVHLTVAVLALVLLVVGGKVLQAGGRARPLRVSDEGSGQLAGQIRVLRQILKIPSAQRGSR